jgi:lipid II:glycine glycyltransferase (peptidoglycan interpeptide bridge formation enzyme)
MEIKEINNKEEWEGFLQNCIEKTFFSSWNWGEFNLAMGNKIWRLGIYDNQKIIAIALILKISAKRATFLFIPHGPAIISGLESKDKKEIIELILNYLISVTKESAYQQIEKTPNFIRVSSLFPLNEENQKVFSDLKFRQSPMHASSYEATWKLDILDSEENILKNMRKTTRYLIKKCKENKDIEIIKSLDPDDIEIYQKLNKAVSKRQGFIPFSNELIKKEFEIFLKDNQSLLLFGKYKGEIVAGAMIIFWQGTAFYHQAASLAKFAKFSIPYLLQWEAIKEARNRGCNVYDFWGFTDPKKFPRHPWAGPTLFKMGFGGYKKEYVKTQDFILSNKYWINYIIEKIRKIRRRL